MILKAGVRSKQNFAYHSIREAILNGTLLPNERLIISKLAAELGVSEIPVREALSRLESEGFAAKASQGMVVSAVSVEEIARLLEIRVELEGLAIKWATDRIAAQEYDALWQLIQDMEAAFRSDDIARFGIIDKQFHSFIYAKCGDEFLLRTIMHAWTHSERSRAMFKTKPWYAETSLHEHRAILDALRDRQPLAAQELLKNHKRKYFNLYIEQLNSLNAR